MTTVEERLSELGLTVPVVAAPVAAYVPAVVSGRYVYTSGQLPFVDGVLAGHGQGRRGRHPGAGRRAGRHLRPQRDRRREVGRRPRTGRPRRQGRRLRRERAGVHRPAGVVNGASNLLKAAFGDAGVARAFRRRRGGASARRARRGRDDRRVRRLGDPRGAARLDGHPRCATVTRGSRRSSCAGRRRWRSPRACTCSPVARSTTTTTRPGSGWSSTEPTASSGSPTRASIDAAGLAGPLRVRRPRDRGGDGRRPGRDRSGRRAQGRPGAASRWPTTGSRRRPSGSGTTCGSSSPSCRPASRPASPRRRPTAHSGSHRAMPLHRLAAGTMAMLPPTEADAALPRAVRPSAAEAIAAAASRDRDPAAAAPHRRRGRLGAVGDGQRPDRRDRGR